MTFQVGDKVVVIAQDSVNYMQECTITSGPELCARFNEFDSMITPVDFAYAVDIYSPVGVYYYTANEIRKVDDDYDGHEVTSWEKCVWQPKELVRI